MKLLQLILICGLFSIFLNIFNIFLTPVVNQYKTQHQIHKNYIPRISFLSFFCIFLIYMIFFKENHPYIFFIFIFLIGFVGLLEDFKNFLSPKLRLVIIFSSSIVFFYKQNYINFPYIDLPLISTLLENDYFEILFFSIAIVAITNGLNMIDGLNGLACFVILSILIPLYLVSYSTVQLLLIFLVINFLLFNFPNAKYFFGDGSVYFIGTFIGIEIITLYGEIDAPSWGAVLLLSYPILEIIISITRRFFYQHKKITEPDNEHLHSLVFKLVSNLNIKNPNAISTILLCPFFIFPPILWSIGYQNIRLISISISSLIIFYCLIYFLIKYLLRTEISK